jgi:hypothetical protein
MGRRLERQPPALRLTQDSRPNPGGAQEIRVGPLSQRIVARRIWSLARLRHGDTIEPGCASARIPEALSQPPGIEPPAASTDASAFVEAAVVSGSTCPHRSPVALERVRP